MSFIIAVLLAVTAGAFAVSTSHSAAPNNWPVLIAAGDVLDHESHSHSGFVHEDHSRGYDHDVAQKDCSDPDRGSSGADCCGIGACHAVQAVSVPPLCMPLVTAIAIAGIGDEQVDGIGPGEFERPPRAG